MTQLTQSLSPSYTFIYIQCTHNQSQSPCGRLVRLAFWCFFFLVIRYHLLFGVNFMCALPKSWHSPSSKSKLNPSIWCFETLALSRLARCNILKKIDWPNKKIIGNHQITNCRQSCHHLCSNILFSCLGSIEPIN